MNHRLQGRALGLAVLLGALLALGAVPAFAAADTFTVNSTSDAGRAAGAEAKCEAEGAPLVCTLRAALEAAKFNANLDHIVFNPAVFNGEPGDTITPASLLAEGVNPVDISGSGCNAGSTVPCLAGTTAVGNGLLVLKAGESKIRNLSITLASGVVGLRAAGGGPGEEILDNTIAMTGSEISASTGIESANGASGALIEGNKITSVLGFNYPISLRGGSNRILGNEISGSGGCCEAGISIELGASGNQIGGDTAGSENVITGYIGGAVSMNIPPTNSPNNEVRRNRGEDGMSFISGGGIAEPVITEALQSSVVGTAEPGATVRVFRKATEGGGEIEGFLAEVPADETTGAWKVTFAKAPAGTLVAATQTLTGSTSGLGETKTLAEEPETGGGGQPGGGGTGTATQTPPPPVVNPPAAPKKPKVNITKGPKKTSGATTAKFRFTATPAAGAKFECKLDAAKWAKCRSPKTYKNLKVGRHTFQVRATAGGLASAVAKFKFTIKT